MPSTRTGASNVFIKVQVYECPECRSIVKDGDICCPPEVYEANQCLNCQTVICDFEEISEHVCKQASGDSSG